MIELSDSVPALDDGARHTVQWRRAADGAMVVLVDGAEVMRATDRAILNPFDGVSILNRGGRLRHLAHLGRRRRALVPTFIIPCAIRRRPEVPG